MIKFSTTIIRLNKNLSRDVEMLMKVAYHSEGKWFATIKHGTYVAGTADIRL